jgi:endonuclease YncB( thermonuclease family)
MNPMNSLLQQAGEPKRRMMRRSLFTPPHKSLLGLILALCLGAVAQAGEYAARCVGVADGDTLTVLRDGNVQERIRLEGIDAPEKSQDYGQRSKAFTSAMTFGKVVTVQAKERDRYGRTVGTVIAPDGRSVNLELVKAGLAWHYREYSKDPTLAEAERSAREVKQGLWSQPNPTPPWEYRKAQRLASAEARGEPAAPPPEDPDGAVLDHWLNTSSGIRHNSGCKYYRNVQHGRPCRADEGKACGLCGG